MNAGDIVVIRYDGSEGNETAGKHSAIVLNNPPKHPVFSLITVVPLLHIKPYHLANPLFFPVVAKSALNKLDTDRVADPFNVRSMSHLRALGLQGKLLPEELEIIRRAVSDSIDAEIQL